MHTTRSLHTTEVPHFHHTTNIDTTLTMNNVVLYGESMITEDLSLRERRALHFMNGIEPNIRGKKGDNVNQKAAYMAYTRYDSDRTSLHHLSYITLLERCSKYLYVNVHLLHNLVTELEKQIVNLAFTGTVDVRSTLSSRSKRTKQNIHHATANAADVLTLDTISDGQKHYSQKEKRMQKYRIQYEQLLPEAHKQGLETLLRRNKRKRSTENADTDGYSSSDSRESYHSINNKTHDDKPGTKHSTEIMPPFVFDPCADFADIEGMFGPSNVIYRKDAPIVKRAKKAKIASTNTNDEPANPADSMHTATINTSTTTVNTPKSSSYLPLVVDTYDSAGASGYDTDANDDDYNRTPPGTPRPLEFDLLHAYVTTQAGERTPPISEITYSRTPFSTVRPTYNAVTTANKLPEMHIFHTAGGGSVGGKQPKKRTDTPHVAAMEALDRLVSAQDSASDSDMMSEDENDNSDDESVVSRGTPTVKTTQPKKPNTENSRRTGGAGSVRGAPLFESPVVNNNPVSTTGTNVLSTVPLSAPTAPVSSGMSLLARAIYGSNAVSSTPAAVAPSQVANSAASNVALRPVVALKRPRVQFQN